MTRRPAKEDIDPQGFVTKESCEDRHKTTESSINWIKGFIALAIAIGGGIVGYAVNESKSAIVGNGDLEVKLESLIGSENSFKDRVIKSLDETRSEMRASDKRIDESIRDLQSGQQRILEIMIKGSRIGSNPPLNKVTNL